MLPLDDALFAVLHDVRLRGVATVAPGDALDVLLTQGLVAQAARGIRITPEGRHVHARLARLTAGSEAEALVQRAYERFLPLNRELVRVCHDWQMHRGDHAIVERLIRVDERIGPVVNHVAVSVTRFSVYRPALRDALEHVDAGEHEWVASPRHDSYHTVWMRLHEDLLLAVGAAREQEPEA
ncbi:MAG TPA: hypothetical protein VFR41_08855 [Acidimicrobiia bacterium]|nr:hypothetical protein [Acidimicrobiia bacterium]